MKLNLAVCSVLSLSSWRLALGINLYPPLPKWSNGQRLFLSLAKPRAVDNLLS